MTSLLAIDPGGAVLGWAYFVHGVLSDVGLSRSKAKTWQARAVEHRAALAVMIVKADRVVSECMQYRGSRGKGSPQILIELNGIAGHVAREWVSPFEWKGHVSRDVEAARTRLALSPEELLLLETVRPLSLAHNATSAVGIGLHLLGRAHKR